MERTILQLTFFKFKMQSGLWVGVCWKWNISQPEEALPKLGLISASYVLCRINTPTGLRPCRGEVEFCNSSCRDGHSVLGSEESLNINLILIHVSPYQDINYLKAKAWDWSLLELWLSTFFSGHKRPEDQSIRFKSSRAVILNLLLGT